MCSYRAMLQSFSSFTSRYSTRPSWRKSSKLLYGNKEASFILEIINNRVDKATRIYTSAKHSFSEMLRQKEEQKEGLSEPLFKINECFNYWSLKCTCSPETAPQCVCSSQPAARSSQWCKVWQSTTQHNQHWMKLSPLSEEQAQHQKYSETIMLH